MHRSGSVNRVWDDYVKHDSKNSAAATRSAAALASLETDKAAGTADFIITSYPPSPLSSDRSTTAKREKGGGRSRLAAENAVHFIPLVLFLCAFILWFFSNPDIEVPMSGEAVAARIEGLTIEGDSSDGTQTGYLPLERTTDDIGLTTRYNNNDPNN